MNGSTLFQDTTQVNALLKVDELSVTNASYFKDNVIMDNNLSVSKNLTIGKDLLLEVKQLSVII